MKFRMERSSLIKILKAVNHQGRAKKNWRDSSQWLRVAAHAGHVGLQANGAAGVAPATVLSEGVCFIWYGKLLKIIQSYKASEITMEVVPEGITIESFSLGASAWVAIFDNPETAPPTMDEVIKQKGAGAAFVGDDEVREWWDRALESDWLPGFEPDNNILRITRGNR